MIASRVVVLSEPGDTLLGNFTFNLSARGSLQPFNMLFNLQLEVLLHVVSRSSDVAPNGIGVNRVPPTTRPAAENDAQLAQRSTPATCPRPRGVGRLLLAGVGFSDWLAAI